MPPPAMGEPMGQSGTAPSTAEEQYKQLAPAATTGVDAATAARALAQPDTSALASTESVAMYDLPESDIYLAGADALWNGVVINDNEPNEQSVVPITAAAAAAATPKLDAPKSKSRFRRTKDRNSKSEEYFNPFTIAMQQQAAKEAEKAEKPPNCAKRAWARTAKMVDPRRSLRARLAFAFGLSVLMIAVVYLIVIDQITNSELRDNQGTYVSTLAFVTAATIDRTMYNRQREIDLLASTPSLLGNDTAAQLAAITLFQKSYPYNIWIGKISSNGSIGVQSPVFFPGQSFRSNTTDPLTHGYRFFADARFSAGITSRLNATELVRILSIAAPSFPGDLAIAYRNNSSPAIPAGQMCDGVPCYHGGVYCTLSWSFVNDILDTIRPSSPSATLYVVDLTGTVLSGPDAYVNRSITPYVGSEFVSRVRSGGVSDHSYEFSDWFGGESVLVGAAPSVGFRTFPGAGWTVLVVIPQSVAYDSVVRFRAIVIGTGVAWCVLAFLAGWLIATRIVAPIMEIATAAAQIMADVGMNDSGERTLTSFSSSQSDHREKESTARTHRSHGSNQEEDITEFNVNLVDSYIHTNVASAPSAANQLSPASPSETRLNVIESDVPSSPSHQSLNTLVAPSLAQQPLPIQVLQQQQQQQQQQQNQQQQEAQSLRPGSERASPFKTISATSMAQVVPSLSPPSNRSSSSTSISSLPSNSIMHHATVHAGSANSKVVSTGFFGVSFDSNSTPGAAAKADGHSSSGHAPATHTLSTGSGRLGTTSASAVVRNISQPDAGLSSRRQKSVPMLPAHTSASSQPSVQPPLQHSEHSQQSAQHPLAHSASPQYSQLATSPSSSSTLKPVLSANSTISGNRLENRRVSIDMATHISMHLSPSPAPSPGPLMPGMLSESATSKAMTIARKAMNRKDEVHVLFQSLSNLINTLGHERRLLSINENLEAIINARTRALQEMNQQLKGEIAAKQLVMDDLERARLLAEQAGIAKSHFLANMSHEIRTPMNAVIGLTDILSFTSLTSEQAELVQVIRTSANGLKRIIDDILDLTRIESGKLKIIKERFTVSEFAQDALDLVAYSASVKNITVSCVIMADVPSTVSTDRVRLRQIVINLLSNAIKFTPPNGRVELIFFRRRSRPARDDDATLPKAGAQGVPASSSHSHSTNSHSTNSQSNNSATAASVHPHSSSRSTTSDPAQGFSSSTVSGQSSGMRPNQFKLITPHGADESSSSGSSKHGHSVAATMKRLFGRSDVPAAPRVSDASNPRSDTNLNMISTSIAESVEEEGADEVANHVRQQSTQSGSFQRSQATTARNAAGHSSTVAAPPTITAAMASTIRAAPVAGKSVGTESSSSVVLEGSHSDLHSVGSIAENSNDLIYVAVVDTGPGMSRDLLKRLFTPFTQGDASFTRKTAGTGLGLSISRQLVRLLGGVIAVHSEVGRGSTFTFSFASNRGLWPGADAPLIGQPANPTSGNSSAFEHVRQQSHRSITSSKSGGSASTLQSSAATSNGGSVASTHASSSAKPHPREPIRLQPSTAFNAAMLQSALSGQDFVISRPDPAGGKREPDEALSLTEQQVTQLRLQTQLQHLSTPHSHSIHGSTTSSVHGAGSQQAHNSSTASTSSRKGESPAALGSQQLLVVPHPAANNSPSLPKRHSFSQPVFSTPDDEAIRPQSLPLHSISHPPVSVNSTIPFEYVPQEAPPKQITAAQHAANVANEAIATSAPVGLTASSLAALPSTTLSEQLLPSYVSSLPTPTSAPLTSEPVQVSPSTARKAQQQAAGAASASAAPPQPPQDATAPASRLRLLLAEDNKINQMVALKLLKRLGYNADVAWNGREAVNMCRLKTYDVVLMDLQMPEMDGLEACSIILAEHSDPAERPRIVALTANVFEQDREQCVQVGMVGFLAKPVTAVQLETLLSSMLPLPGRQEDYHDESAV